MAKDRKKSPIVERRDSYIPTLLAKITAGKQELKYRKGEKIFSQGDSADAIYFIGTGRIKISVVSTAGKKLYSPCSALTIFLAKGRWSTNLSASARLKRWKGLRYSVSKSELLLRALHEQSELSEQFMALLLARNIDLEAICAISCSTTARNGWPAFFLNLRGYGNITLCRMPVSQC